MNKEEFTQLEFKDQLTYLNENLAETTLKNLCKSTGISSTTVRRNFLKNGYEYNSTNKQYEVIKEVDKQLINNNTKVPTMKHMDEISISKTKSNTNNNIKDNNRNNIGNIIINKTVNTIVNKRCSYYLNVSTIKNIERLAKESNMGISEFLQCFLDATLNLIKIE